MDICPCTQPFALWLEKSDYQIVKHSASQIFLKTQRLSLQMVADNNRLNSD